MFATKLHYGFLLLTLLSPASTLAQLCNYDEPPGGYHQPVSPLPPDFCFTYHHASTAAEGWLRGRAAVIHATGNYWLSVSQALICREQARWLALANRERWIEHCIQLRAFQEAERQRRIEQRRIANQARWLSKYKVYLLTPSQFDRATGEINWPAALQAAEYRGARERLAELFRQRAGYFDSPIGGDVELRQCVESLSRSLRRNIGTVDRTDYLTAQKFLCGLKYENVFAAQVN